MTPFERFDSRVRLRVAAAVASVALHLGLVLFAAFSGGDHEGIHESDTPLTQLVFLDEPAAARRDGSETGPIEAQLPAPLPELPRIEENVPGTPPPGELPDEAIAQAEPDPATMPAPIEAVEEQPLPPVPDDQPSTFVMTPAERSALEHRLARLAQDAARNPQSKIRWEQNGRQFSAALVMHKASDGIDFDRVIAEVSAEDQGRQLTTHIRLKRLSFSHFTQMIDRWDPSVQMHDDEIIGRFHVNSSFNLLYDRSSTPRFIGKVTTASKGFNAQANSHRRDSEVFKGGIETSAGRIELPEEIQPFAWGSRKDDAVVHECRNDTEIRFFPDGSYSWRDRVTGDRQYRNEPSDQPVYFMGTQKAAFFVQGVVRGKVLVYSPQRITIEGKLVYARDPRKDRDSTDYLGLVSRGVVDIAGPGATGPGDLDVQAAIFAGRRFVVTNIDQPRTATLRIYGSLAAGSVSASEPRYGMKVEYDPRLERLRPPGFPSTDRFAAEEWDGVWNEAREGVTSTL